jgi:hypothetical protein
MKQQKSQQKRGVVLPLSANQYEKLSKRGLFLTVTELFILRTFIG